MSFIRSKDSAIRVQCQNGLLVLLWILLGVSCAGNPTQALPSQAPTPTQLVVSAVTETTLLTTRTTAEAADATSDATAATVTYAPIVTITRRVPQATHATATPGCAPDAETAAVRYDIDSIVDWDTRSANGVMHIHYRNETGRPQKDIVFNVEPNQKPGLFTLSGLEIKGSPSLMGYVLTGPRLDVQLQSPLEENCQIQLMLRFSVRTNSIPEGPAGKHGYYGFSDRQINLSEWLPQIAPFINGQWVTSKSWSLGEYTIWGLGDYDVRVTVNGGDQEHMEVIAPGEMEKVNPTTWRFKIANARTFTLTVGFSMSKISATSDDGVVIDLYYFPKSQPTKGDDGSPINGAQHALDTAKGAINQFSKLYGPPPFKRIVVVEADFPDGMEFSGLVFVGHQWFAAYTGKPDSWVTMITAHEIAHQWWYSAVGNDQSTAPYLDEALAIYSEVLYFEAHYPDLVPWWWSYRIKLWQPIGSVDSTVYDFQGERLYINAVYLRGAMMLQEIREKIGSDSFFKWLRDYETTNRGKIATPLDFWGAMSTADYDKIAEIRAKYLHQPDPLHPPTPTPADQATGAATQAASQPATQAATSPATQAATAAATQAATTISVSN